MTLMNAHVVPIEKNTGFDGRGTGRRKDKPSPFKIGTLVSRSSEMSSVIEQIERVAETSATVLIHGESGTGKEIVAQAIHNRSRRCDKPFLPVNCGALSPQLIESELFGHERGSFTGAVRDRPGVFERAHGGTLFLDEITEMPLDLQVKLLRVLETQRFSRLGSVQEQRTDVRILAATNRCLQEEVEQGNLREDLFYRIQVFPIALPPLREREGDVSLLAEHFLKELNETEGTDKRFSDEALALLNRYCWPGNVRELRNVVQRAYIMAKEVVTTDDFPDMALTPGTAVQQQGQSLKVKVGASVAEVERNLIYATLNYCDGRKQKAADMLGVSVKTLYNRLREYEEADHSVPH